MVQSWKSFLEEQKRLKAAAKKINMPWTTDVEEQSTAEINPIEKEEEKSTIQRAAETITESKVGQAIIGAWESIEKWVEKAKVWLIKNIVKKSQTPLGQKLLEAATETWAEWQKIEAQAAIEGAQSTQEERDILAGGELKKTRKQSLKDAWKSLEKASRIWAEVAMPYFAPIIQSVSDKLEQKREDTEKNTYLSDWRIVVKEPTLAQENWLENAKSLAASISYAYLSKGQIPTAQQVRDAFEGFDDVSDDTINNFISWVLYNTVNQKEINRELVAEKYWDMVKSDNYTSKKQAVIDLFLNDNTRLYWMTDELRNNIEADAETKKVIDAYKYIGVYAERLQNNWYNQYGSTARWLAQAYKDADLEIEGWMSLKDAYETAAKYDPNKLANLVKQISYNLQSTEKYAQRKYKSVEEYPGRWDARAAVVNYWRMTKEFLKEFAEFTVEQESQDPAWMRYSPVEILDTFVAWNSFTDADGNIRGKDGQMIYERQSDWTYKDAEGRNVTAMWKINEWFLKSIWNHIEWITEGLGETMKWMWVAETTLQEEWIGQALEYETQVLAGITSTAFNTMLLANPEFLALESTPIAGQWINQIFTMLSEFWANTTMATLQMLNLADKMDPENVKAAQELWGTIATIRALKKYKQETDPAKKAFKEAFEKAWKEYQERMVDIMGKDNLNEKIKNPKGTKTLEDKTEKKEEAIDVEGKTIDEVREEIQEKKTGEVKETTKQEVVTQTPKDTEMKVEEPTEKKIIDQISTKDKLGYVFQVNKAVMSEMLQSFKKYYKEALDKYTKKWVGSAVEERADQTANAELKELANEIKWTSTFSFKDMVNNVWEGLRNIWNAAKNLPKRIGEKITTKRANDAYDKMGLSGEEKTTLKNNSKVWKLGDILNRLISSKKGKLEKEKNIKGGQIEKFAKEEIAKDWLNDAKQIWNRLKERRKTIHDNLYQKLNSTKNIKFWQFFTWEKWLRQALNELIRNDPDIYSYIQFREVDGKIVMDYKKGYSTKFDNNIVPELKKIIKEYNDMVEKGNVSEMNISKLNDMFKDLIKRWTDMKRSQSILDQEMWTDLINMGYKLKQALNSYLQETGQAKNLLLGEKASAEVWKIEEQFKKLFDKGEPSPEKVVKFLESLTEDQAEVLDQLISTTETIDLMKNGSTSLKKIYDFVLSTKELKSTLGEFLTKSGRLKDNAVSRFGTLLWVMFMGTGWAKIIAAIWGLLTITWALNKLEGRIVNKAYTKNLKKAVQKAIKNPQNKEQLENIAEGLDASLSEIDARILNVIKARNQKVETNKMKTTEATEKTETKSERQEGWEQRDTDMVVLDQEALPEGEETQRLTDERQYLEDKRTPEEAEAELQKSLEDFEVQIKRALKNLRDMIDDSDNDGWNGGWIPKKPTDPDTQGVVDTIDDFLAEMGANETPKGEEKPNFSNWSNESIWKLYNSDGTLKEEVPTVYEEELSNEIKTREAKKEISDVKDQNNIITKINNELDKVKDGKREDIEADEFQEDIQQAWNVDQYGAAEIFDKIVNGEITEIDNKQKKTSFEDNEEASKWIEKRTGKETKPTKSASRTSSLEVRDTKPDSQGKLNALKNQLAAKKESLKTTKTAKTLQKKQAEIDKLEKEITRLEEKLNAKELDSFDLADKEAVDKMTADDLSQEVSSTEEKPEPQTEEGSTMDDLMTFRAKDKSPEEIKKVQAELTKRKNDWNLDWYSLEEVDKQIKTLNNARIWKQESEESVDVIKPTPEQKGKKWKMYHATVADFEQFFDEINEWTYYNDVFWTYVTDSKPFLEDFMENKGKMWYETRKEKEIDVDIQKPVLHPDGTRKSLGIKEADKLILDYLELVERLNPEMKELLVLMKMEDANPEEFDYDTAKESIKWKDFTKQEIIDMEGSISSRILDAKFVWEWEYVIDELFWNDARADREILKKKGYDAMMVYEGNKDWQDIYSYALFYPNRYKSSTKNID